CQIGCQMLRNTKRSPRAPTVRHPFDDRHFDSVFGRTQVLTVDRFIQLTLGAGPCPANLVTASPPSLIQTRRRPMDVRPFSCAATRASPDAYPTMGSLGKAVATAARHPGHASPRSPSLVNRFETRTAAPLRLRMAPATRRSRTWPARTTTAA